MNDFYIGQRIQVHSEGHSLHGCNGTITGFEPVQDDPVAHVAINDPPGARHAIETTLFLWRLKPYGSIAGNAETPP